VPTVTVITRRTGWERGVLTPRKSAQSTDCPILGGGLGSSWSIAPGTRISAFGARVPPGLSPGWAAVYRVASLSLCENCGAALVMEAAECAYCRRPNPYFQQREQVRQQAADEAAQAARRQHERLVDRKANYALVFAVVGLLCCLFPIPGIIAVVVGRRALALARTYGVREPTKATLGVVLGLIPLPVAALFYGWVIVREIERAERIEELEAQVAAPSQAQVLQVATACELAELRLLRDGLEGHTGGSFEGFECAGRFTVAGDRATLDDFTFNQTDAGRASLRVCFTRGTRWALSGFRKTATCDAPEDGPLIVERRGRGDQDD
jgi:hypothetical protein